MTYLLSITSILLFQSFSLASLTSSHCIANVNVFLVILLCFFKIFLSYVFCVLLLVFNIFPICCSLQHGEPLSKTIPWGRPIEPLDELDDLSESADEDFVYEASKILSNIIENDLIRLKISSIYRKISNFFVWNIFIALFTLSRPNWLKWMGSYVEFFLLWIPIGLDGESSSGIFRSIYHPVKASKNANPQNVFYYVSHRSLQMM